MNIFERSKFFSLNIIPDVVTTGCVWEFLEAAMPSEDILGIFEKFSLLLEFELDDGVGEGDDDDEDDTKLISD